MMYYWVGHLRVISFFGAGIILLNFSAADIVIPDTDDPGLGLPPIVIPEDSKLTKSIAKLGKKLFFDKLLSRDGTISCATCHVPEQGFTQNDKPKSVGIDGKIGRRNTPTLLNIAFADSLFVDGRASSLEDQAWQPILAEDEMGNSSVSEVLDKISSDKKYQSMFKESFGEKSVRKDSVAIALSTYQRVLVSGESSYDRWYYESEGDAMGASAQRGYQLFAGQAQCWHCHQIAGPGVLFSDNLFHNTGVSFRSHKLGASEDLGRYEITKIDYDKRTFKTPTLRNVALTAPYMHDGSLSTLEEVVRFYNDGGSDDPLLSPIIGSLNLSKNDIKDIVQFLHALNGNLPLKD